MTRHPAEANAEIPLGRSTRLGLNYELAIAPAPDFFVGLSAMVAEHGGTISVIAMRPPTELAALWRDLDEAGIRCDRAYCLPVPGDAVKSCPHRAELGHTRSWLWHKVRIAFEAGLTHYVDGDPATRELFRQYLPSVACFYPWELNPGELFSDAVRSARVGMTEENLERITRRDFRGVPSTRPPVSDSGLRGYAVIAEGDDFANAIRALGGYLWGPPPYTIAGQWMVFLPESVPLVHGELTAGGFTCRIVGVSPMAH